MSEPRVLLTGFPGFLGSALLERILARGDGPVACLVQPRYRELAERRADALTAGVEGVDDGAIQLFDGDITEPDLGLDASLEAVESCYHLAAVYDLGVDEDTSEAVNVHGTEHVLDVATSLDVEAFHYVSTCYVSGRYDGVFTESNLQEGQSFNNHYEKSKYRAEVAVQERMAEGFPATVYRPAVVVGDSQTGETDKFDGPYNLLRLLRAQPRALAAAVTVPGASRAELNVVPRDFVIDAIAHLSDQGETGQVYQLCDPAPLSVDRFVSVLAAALGHRTVRVPTTKPIARRAVGLLERLSVHVDPHALDYLDHPTRYACPATQRALADTGIGVPAFESYVDQLVAFARENPDVGDDAMV